MRVLLISDIHSNLEALEACLAAAPPHDMVVNLGDIVGYGASPNEVIERSRALGHIFVRGNHDKAASGAMDLRDFNPIAGLAALWTRDQLTPQNLKWLLGAAPWPDPDRRTARRPVCARLAGGRRRVRGDFARCD